MTPGTRAPEGDDAMSETTRSTPQMMPQIRLWLESPLGAPLSPSP